MNNVEDLERLAGICLENAKTLKEYLHKNGHAQPTFDQNGPLAYPRMSSEAENARLVLRSASKTLYDLAVGPDNVALHAHECDLNAYRYVWRYEIAFAIPDNETISYKDVAEKTGTDEKQMAKFVRQLMTVRIFCEPKPGHVAHTAASRVLKDPLMSAYNGHMSNDIVPLMANQLEAIERWGHGSQEFNQTPANIVYGNDASVYESWQQRPDIMSRFSKVMIHASELEVFNMSHALNGFDWSLLGGGTVVDIGGNIGHCSIEIAKAHPTIKFVVQDLPNLVARAKNPETTIVPQDLQDRISFMEHDFFTPQPLQAEAYFLRMIMHDWSDKYCIKILRAILPAMKSGSRIIIMDRVMPPFGMLPLVHERFARILQLHMQLLSNGVEREVEEWVELFKNTDTRLKIKNIELPPGSLMSIIEVMLEE